MSGVSAYTAPTATALSSLQSKPKSTSLLPRTSSNLKLKGFGFGEQQQWSRSLSSRCNASSGPGGPGSGDGDSRTVLDAFFLGKALAEAVNERVESAVGEFFSTIGRLQAEQQKQVQEFQEDVLERAKRAKEKAAREAMEAQGLVPKATTLSNPDGGSSATSPTMTNGSSTPSDATEDPTKKPISGASSDS